MLYENWATILLTSFLVVVCANALLASCTKRYYKNKSPGHLSHSQLRIKQGTATFDHRLNIFAQTLAFSLVSFRIYLITMLVWLASSGAYQLLILVKK